MDEALFAKRLVTHVDLTRLAEHDAGALKALCDKAINPLGTCAALCVYPRDLTLCREYMGDQTMRYAAVANFPSGDDSLLDIERQIEAMLEAGADECDVVLPYTHFLQKDYRYCETVLKACRQAFTGTLKVILETGALIDELIIRDASQCAIDCGADFLKTSTGHVPDDSLLDSAAVMLQVIQENEKVDCGIKISGGIRTIEQAKAQWQQIESVMAEEWMTANHVRIGASRLLDELLAVEGT